MPGAKSLAVRHNRIACPTHVSVRANTCQKLCPWLTSCYPKGAERRGLP